MASKDQIIQQLHQQLNEILSERDRAKLERNSENLAGVDCITTAESDLNPETEVINIDKYKFVRRLGVGKFGKLFLVLDE